MTATITAETKMV